MAIHEDLEQLQGMMMQTMAPAMAGMKLSTLSEMCLAACAVDEMVGRATTDRQPQLAALRDRLVAHCLFIDSQIKTGTEPTTS